MKITVTYKFSATTYGNPATVRVRLSTDEAFHSMGIIDCTSHETSFDGYDFNKVHSAARKWAEEKTKLTKQAYTAWRKLQDSKPDDYTVITEV